MKLTKLNFVRTPSFHTLIKEIAPASLISVLLNPAWVIDISLEMSSRVPTTTWEPKNLIFFSKKVWNWIWLVFWLVLKSWNQHSSRSQHAPLCQHRGYFHPFEGRHLVLSFFFGYFENIWSLEYCLIRHGF